MGCAFWILDADGEAAGSICSKSIQIFTWRSFLIPEHNRSLKITHSSLYSTNLGTHQKWGAKRWKWKTNSVNYRRRQCYWHSRRRWKGRTENLSNSILIPFKQVEFDRIVTNEMFEHMKNYDRLFEKVSKWLKPETGLLFIHVFCHRNYPYQFKVKSSNNADWMAKNYFTGGSMPSYGQISRVVLVDFKYF